MYALVEEHLRQVLGNITLVAIKFAEKLFLEHFNNPRVAVIGIAGGEAETEYLPFFIANERELEAMGPTLVLFPRLANPSKVLWLKIRLLWQTLILVLSTKLIPVHFPKQAMFRKSIIGANTLCSTAMKRLHESCLGIPRADAHRCNADKSV